MAKAPLYQYPYRRLVSQLFILTVSTWRIAIPSAAFASLPPNYKYHLNTHARSREQLCSDEICLKFASSDTNSGTPKLVRGSGYGTEHNSTIPTPEEAAKVVGVKPTKLASPKTWSRAWKLQKFLLPILHSLDGCKPPDSSLNIACMWWKALAGNDKNSPVYDAGLAYDVLPRGFRVIVGRKLRRFYPRLHHANVEIRTAFLDRAITNVIDSIDKSTKMKIRLVSFGAGYDLRSVKFMERKLVDKVVELDLEKVVEGKQKLLGPKRLLKRRPWLKDVEMPVLVPADLNDLHSIKRILEDVLTKDDNPNGESEHIKGGRSQDWYTIFVFEGVMIYLNEGVPSALLNITSSVLQDKGLEGSLCFADRLENIPGGDQILGREELGRNGWELIEWCPKPGLARHMGAATLKKM